MSISICNSHLKLSPLRGVQYQLTVAFSGPKNEMLSSKQFTFSPGADSQQGVIWDVYSQNTTCHQIKSAQFFSSKEVKEIGNAWNLVKQGPKLLVLDVQGGGDAPYLSNGISQCEMQFCDFLEQVDTKEVSRSYKALKSAISLFETQGIPDFVLCEGSLKKDLLEKGGFSKEEQAFLQKKGKEGSSMQFCQLAEVFMNGFKFGHTAMASATLVQFSADSYLTNISHQFSQLTPCTTSAVLYPPLYQEIYSPEAPFFQMLKEVFPVSGSFDSSTGITTVCVGGEG